MKKGLIILSVFIFLFTASASRVSAQLGVREINVNNVISLPDELTMEISPTYPGPFENVRVDLRMYTEDLDSALITWLLDGKKKAEGRGLVSFNFKAPGPNAKTTLTVNITLQNGQKFSKSASINPGSVDILWQAPSYTTPFYKGKALFPKQGLVVVEAVPFVYSAGKKISADRLVYKWTVDNRVLENQSGYGKSVVKIEGSILGLPITVNILVTDPVTNATAEKRILIEPVDPIVAFYENSPLYGIVFEKALNGGFDLKTEEMSVVGAPFYLTVSDNPLYSWKMNGKYVPGVSGLSATFRKPDDRNGSTDLALKIENEVKILQFAENSFRIKYQND